MPTRISMPMSVLTWGMTVPGSGARIEVQYKVSPLRNPLKVHRSPWKVLIHIRCKSKRSSGPGTVCQYRMGVKLVPFLTTEL
eukprot:3941053-Rhodomonas_salina.2